MGTISKNFNTTVFGIKSTVKNAWKSMLQAAGIDDLKFHDCRHTAATRMIASGSEHTQVIKIIGHTQIKTFLRYLNINQETAQTCASNLDNYLCESGNRNLPEE